MNTVTATGDRIELILANAAWQLGERVLALCTRAARTPAGVLTSLASVPRAWRLAIETRRAEAAFVRLSDHQLRDLGVHRTDLLLQAGARPRCREI